MIYVTDARPYGELVDVRELVQPNTFLIRRIINAVRLQGDNALAEAWELSVCRIKYPPEQPVDWHRIQAYIGQRSRFFAGAGDRPVVDAEVTELLETPPETLAVGMADCDGQAILACSVLRNFLPPEQVTVTFGTYKGFGHAWVTLMRGNPVVLETTKQYRACDLAFDGLGEGSDYQPMFRFNDCLAEDLAGIGQLLDEDDNGEPVSYLPLDRIGLRERRASKFACLCDL